MSVPPPPDHPVPAFAPGPGVRPPGQPGPFSPVSTPATPASQPLTPAEAARWRTGGRFVMGAGIATVVAGLASIALALAFTVLAQRMNPETKGMAALFVGAGVVLALPALILGVAQFLLGRARHVLAIIPIGILSLVGASSVLSSLRSLPRGYFGLNDALTLGCWLAVLACSWYGWLAYRPLAGRPRPS